MKPRIIYYASVNGCPFCQEKNTNIVKSAPPSMEGLQVECNDCGARGPIYETKDEAITGWELGIMGIEGRMRRI